MGPDAVWVGRRNNAAQAPQRLIIFDVGVWLCVFLGLVALRLRPGLALTLGQDSFQYMSAAQNALDGHFGYTSLVHFDAERSFGVVPAPMVTFPPGYPLALALASLTGLPLATSGLLISLIAMAACLPLLAWLGIRLGLSRVVYNAVLAGFATNAAVNVVAARVASDALFTAIVLFAIGLLVRRDRGKGSTWNWVFAGIAFGLAYLVRYAAMFFIVGLVFVLIRHLLSSDRSMAKRYAIALTVAGVAVLGGIARNIVLVGNWRGGNDKIVSNPISLVLVETVRGVNRLFLGPGSGVAGGTLFPRAVLLMSFAFGVAWLARHCVRKASLGRLAMLRNETASVGFDWSLLALAYIAGLIYAWLKSVISIGEERYLVPLLPLLLLLLGLTVQKLLSAAPERSRRLALLAFTISSILYVYLNLLILQLPQQPGWLPIAASLDARSTDGKSVRTAVYELTGADGTVMANSGQAIGYLLGRRTVSLVGPHFSSMEWTEQSMRETARRFGVRAIVIYAPTGDDRSTDGDVIPSTFVKSLAQGDAPPWMRLEYRASNFSVYALRAEGH
ncbi:MAG: glycosyltransferase family 39 protein [Burkholderiaceae bacterium]